MTQAEIEQKAEELSKRISPISGGPSDIAEAMRELVLQVRAESVLENDLQCITPKNGDVVLIRIYSRPPDSFLDRINEWKIKRGLQDCLFIIDLKDAS